MEKEFIPYEEALALKDLGFDEPCLRGWSDSEQIWYHPDSEITLDNATFSQAFRWFREKYNMLANVYSNASGFLFEYHDTIGGTHRYDSGFTGPNDSGCWDTYEEAELECLKKLIEICKNK